jgi:hypothetical protein
LPITKTNTVKGSGVNRDYHIFNSLMPRENRVNTSDIRQIRLLLLDGKGAMTMKDGFVGER